MAATTENMRYKLYMELDAWQWLNYGAMYLEGMKTDLKKGKINQTQYDSIIKRRDQVIAGYRDATGKDAVTNATNDYKPTTSGGNLTVNANGIAEAFKRDLEAVGDALTSAFAGGKYVVLGIVGVVLLLLIGRR